MLLCKIRILILLLICSIYSCGCFALNELQKIRIWPSPESTRVVFDLTGTAHYKVSTLNNPDRVIIDLKNTKLNSNMGKLNLVNTRIKNISAVTKVNHEIRIILETDQKLNSSAFLLAPNEKYGHRLVLDLELSEKEAILALFDLDVLSSNAQNVASNKHIAKNKHSANATKVVSKSVSVNVAKKIDAKPKAFVVAIDCGHGGEDPGAVGKHGAKEKDIVLAIGKQLKILLNEEPGIKAFLIRNGDYYVSFGERVRRARRHRADLFISIHADAFMDRNANGVSVFVLSNRGASSAAARFLARRENKSDLIGGVRLSNKNDILASVLLDMSQTVSKKYSFEAAQHILHSIGKVDRLHKNNVQSAGFAVLKAPDIPSMLVETGFISHPATERKLKSPAHQRKVAIAIRDGVKSYFANKARTGSS